MPKGNSARSKTAGNVVVVFFGYTQCPDVCPTTLQELVEAKALLGPLGERLKKAFSSPWTLSAIRPRYRPTPSLLPRLCRMSSTPDKLPKWPAALRCFIKKCPATPPTATPSTTLGMYMYDTQGQLRVCHRYGQGAQALATDAKLLLGLADK